MPTLIELPDIDDTVALCRELGLSFIELNMNMPVFCPERLDARVLRKLTAESGVEFTLHLPEGTDLASFQPPVREGHIRCCEDALAWAAEAGVKLANMHMNMGVYFTLPDRKVWVYERYAPQFLASLVEAFEMLLDLANPGGVTLCVENCGDFGRPFIADAVRRLAELPGFALTWDVGHDAKHSFEDTPLILELQDRVAHMHLHDYDGTSNHQVLFTGIVDVPAMLEFAASRGIRAVIEVKTVEALTESVNRIAALGSGPAMGDGG